MVRVGLAYLRETRLAQAAVAAEEPAAGAEHRLGGDGRKLIAPVGLVKRPGGHPAPTQPLHALEEPALVGNAADDQVRMG